MGEVGESLLVESERLDLGEALFLMAGVGSKSGIALKERGFRAGWGVAQRREAGDQDAVEATSAVLHHLSIPVGRQIELEADGRRVRIDRSDAADDLAVLRLCRCEPASCVLSGGGGGGEFG